MKSFSIVAIALCALVALCSGAPVVNQQQALQAQLRFNIYEDFLQGLFSGLVSTTVGSLSGLLTQLITENPLGVGKRSVEGDLAARISIFDFLYDNILADLFGGLVTNTATFLQDSLLNLISTNPLGVGKRSVEGDLAARISIFDFLYDNILADLFGGLVTNTATFLQDTLLGLISSNPLGVGKRSAEEEFAARVDILSFLYDNILQNLFGGLVTNTATFLQDTLLGLISSNPLGVGKRSVEGDLAARISIFDFLYDNILADLFGGIVTNTATLLQDTLLGLISTNPLGVGKRSVSFQQAEIVIKQTIATLIQNFKTFAHQAVAVWTDKQKLAALVKAAIAEAKSTIQNLAQQLAVLVPETIVQQVDQLLGSLQSTLIFWTSGLGGSLGPVIGPFPH
jgi:hypothetical protein